MRPRGFIDDWAPRDKSRHLLTLVSAILVQYAEQLPLTIRQIFYRLVGRHDYPKTERDYKNLCELLNKARRARLVPWSAIRDDGFVNHGTPFYDGANDLFASFRYQAECMRLDRQRDQPRRLYVACEAAGMAPQLARVVDPYGIDVLASGGFDSLTDKHRLGEQWAGTEQPVTVLHIGDYDPSGCAIYDALAEDVGAFAEAYGGDVLFERVAVTPDQALLYNLPSAPPKPTDKRGFAGDETWQAEALDPQDLARIVTDAIETKFYRSIYEAILAEEEKTRLGVLSALDRLGETG